jgi:hypothetical protein
MRQDDSRRPVWEFRRPGPDHPERTVATLVALVEGPQSSLPESVRIILKLVADTFTVLEVQIATLDGLSRRAG